MITLVDPEDFIHEAKVWGAGKDSKLKVRAVQIDDIVVFRFCIPNTVEILETRIKYEDYTKFAFVELGPMLVSVHGWTDPIEELRELSKTLEETNAKLTADYRRESVRPELEST